MFDLLLTSFTTHFMLVHMGEPNASMATSPSPSIPYNQLEAIFSNSVGFIATLNPAGKVTFANNSALNMIDADLSMVKGVDFCSAPWWIGEDQVSSEQNISLLKEACVRVLQKEQYSITLAVRSYKAEVNHLKFTFSPILSKESREEIWFILVEGRDITDLIYAEEQLAAGKECLEEQVQERTKELQTSIEELKDTQSQLVQSEKLAALGSLVAGVSHEISTPLGNSLTAASHLDSTTDELIQQYQSDQLKRSDLDHYLEHAKKSSKMILSNLRRASGLLQGFHQVAVDQVTDTKRTFAFKQFLEETIMSLNPRIKKTNVSVEITCPQALQFTGHPGAFWQIFSNLVVNSLNHGFPDGKQGKIQIHVSVKKNRLIIVFKDNGVGIPEHILPKIFDPFFTTARGRGGTGLGLNILFTLVTNEMDGKIEVDSAPDQGTIFTITLPFSDQ